jgi:hypothetical protein
MSDRSEPHQEPVDFEDVAAAVLNIDPEGIVSQTAGRNKKKADE